MSDKTTVVRYSYSGDKFELLVKPDPAFDYKTGKLSEISKILISEEIYTDSNKELVQQTRNLTKSSKLLILPKLRR